MTGDGQGRRGQVGNDPEGARILESFYMSGYTDEVIVRHGVTTTTSIVSKPFDRETLVSAVNVALAARAEVTG
jgi:hypothetical protein